MKRPESPDVLEDGTWIRRGMTYVWEPAPVAPVELRPAPFAPFAPHDLIACPTCHARMDEFCRRPGSKRHSHDTRLVKRVCACGGPVRPREPMCGFCRAELEVTKKQEAA